jgi:alkanesulfonate monooxygenase SsuD/methylene tetrahydromethanopterin reductase-like flavin-dependent oxidoreductase (luciferase family)
MEFGIFDHLDRSSLPLHDHYEARLKLIEAYEQAGFYAYHCAEHHGTPLGMAPSPSVFLSAVAQRTTSLRFGPLVYTLPLYNPLRLIEEICMLDHMSGGRFQLGVGRGISPIESGFYGQSPENSRQVFAEALEVVLKGLTGKTLDHEGAFYRYRGVPMELAPLQTPHPPLWYGMHSVESAEHSARQGFNIVTRDAAGPARRYTDRYRAVLRETRPDAAASYKIGLVRLVVVAESDAEAMDSARRAYRRWRQSFSHLYWKHGRSPGQGEYPEEFDGFRDSGRAVAGSPETVLGVLRAHMAEAAANYLIGQFAFGDLSLDEALRSVNLFARHVMPALKS